MQKQENEEVRSDAEGNAAEQWEDCRSAFLSIFLKKSYRVCPAESCRRSRVQIPQDLCWSCSGQPRGTGSQQQSSCPGSASVGDGTGDSHGCFCSPKTSREYGKKGQVFLRKAGRIYSQLRSVESSYLPLWYAEPLVSPAPVPQTTDDFENEGTTIKDTSK